MADVTAIILAAGRGTRMGPRGTLMPKGLFELGGYALVEESVATLRRRGIGPVIIVTGHLADAYEAARTSWAEPVELRYNPLYAEQGSLRSMLVGIADREGGCVTLESDFIYEPRALDFPMEDKSWLLTSGPTGAGDEVYVWADARPDGHRQLRDMSKNRAHRPEPHAGELVGVHYLAPADVARMKAVGEAVVAANPGADYESGLVRLATETPIHCPLIEDLAWAEMDDEAMFERAAALYPRIATARQARLRSLP